jgi:hypothetical protein
MDLIFSKPDSVVEFLSNYITNSKMNLSEKIKQNFAAFLAAFSAPPVGESDTDQKLPSEAETNTLNTLFEAVSASYPESFTSVEGFTSLQKAEALTAFFSSVSDKLQTSLETEQNQKTAFDALNTEHQALVSSNETTLAELTEANTRIQDLTAQLGARPSIPLNVTDPAVGLSSGSQEKDETGKQILAAMPKDIKRKLKNNG